MDYIALGCMTGTSLDGIDCSLVKSDGTSFVSELINEFTPYSKKLQKELSNIIDLGYLDNPKIINLLNLEYTAAINNIIQKFNKNIDIIGVHGQTIFHDPVSKVSMQLYDKKLKYNSSAPIICNFRKNDILNGGTGAPILPEYHQIIVSQKNLSPCIFVNIGGVTNITIIDEQGIRAGDSSFGNALINDFIKDSSYYEIDHDGILSNGGKVIDDLFKLIIGDDYIKKKLPKSLDRNYFHSYFNYLKKNYEIKDVICTLLSIIPKSIKQTAPPNRDYKIILSGGGRKNLTLISLFKEYFDDVSLIDDYQLDGDFIESQGIALLAIRYLKSLPSTYKDTTGIKRKVYLGERC